MTVSISVSIANGDDDAVEGDGGAFFLSTGPVLEVIAQAGGFRQNVGLRFVSGIPPGSTIVSATLDVSLVGGDATDDMDADILAEAVDEALDFVDLADVTSRSRTTASVVWSAANLGVGVVTSPDFTSVLQEVISRPGFAGGAVVIFLDGLATAESQANIDSFENIGGSPAPLLNVEFTLSFGDAPSVIITTNVQRIPDRTVLS